MMETSSRPRGASSGIRIRGSNSRSQSRNRHWVADHGRDPSAGPSGHGQTERWERGGIRGGRGKPRTVQSRNKSVVFNQEPETRDEYEATEEDVDLTDGMEEEEDSAEEPELETQEEREKFYQELLKAREVERKKAIAEGKMDDPLVPKRLDEAITMVGTCLDMCPRFERYRRERENNLAEWETIPGTRRVDHKRAVKAYERAAGDKTLPSDLRPPHVLRTTLDYLFHDLLLRGGFSQTHTFIRDRSRAVRNDFTMQHETGPLAIECHDRCARYHILALHFLRDKPGFSIALEEQQLMNTLQSLKEYYEDQRGRYESPTELEMRVYHRLIHIRDQRERHDDIPSHILEHPVFKLTTQFRLVVQAKSAPITKTSALKVDDQGMEIFGQLVSVLRESGSLVMIYLVACILERLFGTDTIEDIESIRGELAVPDVIDGVSSGRVSPEVDQLLMEDDGSISASESNHTPTTLTSTLSAPAPAPVSTPAPPPIFSQAINGSSSAFTVPSTNAFGQLSTFPSQASGPSTGSIAPQQASAFASLKSTPNAFGGSSVFGKSAFPVSASTPSVFTIPTPTSSAPASAVDATMTSPTPTDTAPPFSSIAASPLRIPSTSATPFSTMPLSNFGIPPPSQSYPFPGTDNVPSPAISSSARPTSTTAPSSLPSHNLALNPTAPVFEPTTIQPAPSFSSSLLGSSSQPSVPLNGHRAETVITPSQVPPTGPQPSQMEPLFLSTTQVTMGSPSQATGRRPLGHRPTLRLESTHSSGTGSPVNDQPRTPLDAPPHLRKVEPVSLPSTPTSSFQSAPPRSANPLLAFPSIRSEASLPSGMLSPLFASPSKPSSTTLLHPSGSLVIPPSKSVSSQIFPASGSNPPNGTSPTQKGKEKASSAQAEHIAFQFEKKSLVVTDAFREWHRQTSERVQWREACRRSDAYKQKVERERLSATPIPDKRRRSVTGSPDSVIKKRTRRRVLSGYKAPQTDEELARRLSENQQENSRRWAQGSFLRSIRTHLQNLSSTIPTEWRLWITSNPVVDATAIWVQHKFDIPAAGEWVSEGIFGISVDGSDPSSDESPALIVFECTPLAGVEDDLERESRVLEDCYRLRDIVESLPQTRRYQPSLLYVTWSEDGTPVIPQRLLNKTEELLREGVVASHTALRVSTSTKDIDGQLTQVLLTMDLDLVGRLQQQISLRALFKQFASAWQEFASDSVEKCSTSLQFDWRLFRQALHALIRTLRAITDHIALLLKHPDSQATLSLVYLNEIVDSDSAYDSVLSWLEEDTLNAVSAAIVSDLQSHRDMGASFPVSSFIDCLPDLEFGRVEHALSVDGNAVVSLPKKELADSVQAFILTIESESAAFYQIVLEHARRLTPKRRIDEDEDEEGRSPTSSAKRMKMSLYSESQSSEEAAIGDEGSPSYDGPSSPSPSVTTSASMGDKSLVTVAMLRALTRDVLGKYSGGR